MMRLSRHVTLILSLLSTMPAWALQNQLRDHPSPYLAMHADDPVAWQDWGPEVIALAREEGRLILVSSGYFSCHWCHVMQRESYQNRQIAEWINRHFVPVKLDRELHGALDAYLIDFLEQTQGRAGWPLNVFITPEGYPLIGAIYLPPERFHELLKRLHGAWTDERREIRNLARRTQLQLMLNRQSAEVPALPVQALREALLREATSLGDVMEGGFGDQSRFPMAPQLLALLRLQAEAPHPQLAEFLLLTLDQIAAEGLRDHLAGGFFRYTVDPSWQVPHFEKMLYTQALLSEVYLLAGQVFGRDDYSQVAHDTLRFVMDRMVGPQGAYVASFSAIDGKGEEGGVYLWHIDELHQLLGEEDTALARRHWRMLDLPAFEAGHLPRRGEDVAQIAAATGQSADALRERLALIRGKLLDARAQRVLPVDDKELAGWNGLMLAALSRAAKQSGEQELHAAATGLRDFLRRQLWDGTRLLRARDGAQPVGRASLEDYAYVAYGMDAYADLSADPVDRTFVAALLNAAWQRYHGAAGWRLDDQPLLPGMGAEQALREGALPAPSALLIEVAGRSGDPQLQAMARAAAEAARAQAQDEPFWYAGHLGALLDRGAPGS